MSMLYFRSDDFFVDAEDTCTGFTFMLSTFLFCSYFPPLFLLRHPHCTYPRIISSCCTPFSQALLVTVQHSHLRSVWVQPVFQLSVQQLILLWVQQWVQLSVQRVFLLWEWHHYLRPLISVLKLQAMEVPNTLKSIFFVYFFLLLCLSVQQFIYINSITCKDNPAMR